MPKNTLPDTVPSHVVSQLLEKDWGELEVLEDSGRLLFPEKIYKIRGDKKFEAIPVLVSIPRLPDLRKARVEARRIALEDGLDLAKDRDLVDDLEVVCTLSHCVLNIKPPHERQEPFPRALESQYDKSALTNLWARIDAFTQLTDPAPESISEEEMVALSAAISRERNISPLAVYGSVAQSTYIITMADLVTNLQESKSSSESSDSPTPESSPPIES
jgi:hypothetical protein